MQQIIPFSSIFSFNTTCFGSGWPSSGVFFISGVGLSPLDTAATSGLLYKPQMIDKGDCGAIGGMKIGRGNRSSLNILKLLHCCIKWTTAWAFSTY
jgi:hypothetical protein